MFHFSFTRVSLSTVCRCNWTWRRWRWLRSTQTRLWTDTRTELSWNNRIKMDSCESTLVFYVAWKKIYLFLQCLEFNLIRVTKCTYLGKQVRLGGKYYFCQKISVYNLTQPHNSKKSSIACAHCIMMTISSTGNT